MDKKAKFEKAQKAIKEIIKKFGKDSIYTLDDDSVIQNIPRISTGIKDLDDIIGGGIPKGRIIEIYGAEGAGKTTLLYQLLAQFNLSLDIPIEGTFDIKRAKTFGNKKGQLLVSRANFGEQALETGFSAMSSGFECVAIDSVPSMITKNEFEETDFEKQGQRGRIAAMLSSKLPKIVSEAEKSQCTWIFINQLRDEMNAAAFQPQTHTPGGRALKHYCSLRLLVTRKDWIKIPNKKASNSAKDELIGCVLKIKVVKSKVSPPLGECEIPVIFDTGFVTFDQVTEIRNELMQKNRSK